MFSGTVSEESSFDSVDLPKCNNEFSSKNFKQIDVQLERVRTATDKDRKILMDVQIIEDRLVKNLDDNDK